MTARLVRLAVADPGDIRALEAAVEDGLDLATVRAVVGKTEGNGCVNDFSRDLAMRVWREALGDEVVAVMSGGTEGVLSPHVTILADDGRRSDADGDGALAIGAARSAPLSALELGRWGQVEATADATRRAAQAGGIEPDDAALVLVKCPLLRSETVTELRNNGDIPVVTDPLASMGASRGASALGVGLALGELDAPAVGRGLEGDPNVWSAVASTSSGIELDHCEVVVLGASPRSDGPLRIGRTVMRDALDATPVLSLLKDIEDAGGRVVQVFAKAEPDPSGVVRGRRHTMLTDSDLAGSRHARAAVGGLLAGLVGEPAIYVSGGAEHQGPPGGGPVAMVWSTDDRP